MKVDEYLAKKLMFKFKTLLAPLWVTRWGRVAWICGLVDQIIIVIVSSTIFFGPKKTHFKSRKGMKSFINSNNLLKIRFFWDFAKIADILKSWQSSILVSYFIHMRPNINGSFDVKKTHKNFHWIYCPSPYKFW